MAMCLQPGCGCRFFGENIGKCPSCDENPGKLDSDATYSAEEKRGREMMFMHLPYEDFIDNNHGS